MRSIDKTSLSISGKIINIYKIEGLKFYPSDLIADRMYEVSYRLGSKEVVFDSYYVDSTEDCRTLIFKSPHNMMGTIGIPSMNILSIRALAK